MSRHLHAPTTLPFASEPAVSKHWNCIGGWACTRAELDNDDDDGGGGDDGDDDKRVCACHPSGCRHPTGDHKTECTSLPPKLIRNCANCRKYVSV